MATEVVLSLSTLDATDAGIAGANAIIVALLLIAAAWRVLTRRSFDGPVTNLVILSVATAVWSATTASIFISGSPGRWSIAVVILSGTTTATAAFLVTWQISSEKPFPPPWAIAIFVIEPIVAAALVFALSQSTPGITSFGEGPLFVVQMTYTGLIVVATLIRLAYRQGDQDRLVRRSIWWFEAIIVLVVATEFGAPALTPVVAGASVLGVVWLSSRPAPWTSAAIRHERLLDEIGAAVLVFDDSSRLTAWNEPASRLLKRAGQREPTAGTRAEDILGVRIPFAGRRLLQLAAPPQELSATAYTTQSPRDSRHTKWVVVVRADHAANPTLANQHADVVFDHLDDETNTLRRSAILDRIRLHHRNRERVSVLRVDVTSSDESEDSKEAMQHVAQSLLDARGGVLVGRVERSAFVALLPDPAEATGLSVALRARFDDFEKDFGTALSVSVVSASKADDEDDFIRRVLAAPELAARVKWQPRWY